MTASPPAPERPRNFGLDLFRALAILPVLICHGFPFLPPFPGYGEWFAVLGVVGVELFFVLSGFLIGRILLRRLDAHQLDFSGLKSFWIRRWFRTLPAYYLVLGLACLVHPVPEDVALYLVFAQNLGWRTPWFFTVSWSLSIEEWFYLLLPLLLSLVCSRRMSAKRVLTALLGYIAVFTLLRLTWALDPNTHWDFELRQMVLTRLDSIGYGVLVAWFATYCPEATQRWKKWAALAGALIAAGCALRLAYLVDAPATIFDRAFLLSCNSIGLAAMLPAFASLRTAPGWVGRPVTWLSKTSYAAYLIHKVLIADPMIHRGVAASLGPWLAFPVYLAVTLLLSTLVFYGFERPTTKLRERFAPRRPG